MGTAATILLPQISHPGRSRPGRLAFRRRLKFLCASSGLADDHPQRLWAQQVLAVWEAGLRQPSRLAATGTLTPREIDVLCELAQERSTKLIARKLLLSPETVKHHLKGIYSKLEVGAREEAVAKARLLGLIP